MPKWIGAFKRRVSIAEFLRCGCGLVAGIADLGPADEWVLADDTGRLTLVGDEARKLDLADADTHLLAVDAALDSETGDSKTDATDCPRVRVDRVVYCRRLQENAEFRTLLAKHRLLTARSHIIFRIRKFFVDHGFVELETPVRVACPGVEEFLDFFEVPGGFLRTSPELHLKRLLVGGFDRIFEIGPCFRRGDHGRLHRPEFTLLEWYRRFADLNHLAQDIEELFKALAPYSHAPEYFGSGLVNTTCRDLFRHYLELELRDNSDTGPLKHKAEALGLPFDPNDDWDSLYFRLFLHAIEPHLGWDRPLLVHDYPASQAALAKLKPIEPGAFPSCYRFELYIRGTEIANAFYELCDADEQEQRFDHTRAERDRAGRRACPTDADFLAALRCGMPPSAGIALGVDRLVMHLLDQGSLDSVMPF